jgi:hypothetical protein
MMNLESMTEVVVVSLRCHFRISWEERKPRKTPITTVGLRVENLNQNLPIKERKC